MTDEQIRDAAIVPANVVASELVNQGSGASVLLHPWIYIRS